MIFWISVAGLVAVVTLALIRPLMSARTAGISGDARAADVAADIAVYKDQLKEVTADEARGALVAAEAESARAEIARRLLRSASSQKELESELADTAPGSIEQSARRRSNIAKLSFATSALLPFASLAVYLGLGAPGFPDYPLDARIQEAADVHKPNDLVAKVEAHLRSNPNDGSGWDVIAPVYYAMGRYPDAANAFSKALRLVGETPQRLLGYAKSRIRVENGVIPEDARTSLNRILVLEPKQPEARIWLALAKEQDGKLAEAATEYRKLLAEAPAEAPWKPVIEARLADLSAPAPTGNADPSQESKAAGTEAAPSAPSSGAPSSTQPPSADAAAISAMSPAEQQALITRMVDGLAARLKSDGSDSVGWLKLIRAYQVLGRREDAVKALNEAREKLKDDKAGLAQVEGLAKQLNLGG